MKKILSWGFLNIAGFVVAGILVLVTGLFTVGMFVVQTLEVMGYSVDKGEVCVYNSDGTFINAYTNVEAGLRACPKDGAIFVDPDKRMKVLFTHKNFVIVGKGTITVPAQRFGHRDAIAFEGIATIIPLIQSGW
ncbi:MAG: hypothetical protein C0412_21035 [Flavobacterium sp.]|nr:hypothetical protein [Flavobacterium sp.]